MKRITGITLALLATAVVAVLAANPHFISGPTSLDMGTTLKTCGSIAGLGNQNVTIKVLQGGNVVLERTYTPNGSGDLN